MSSATPSPTAVLERVEALAPGGEPLTTPEIAAAFDCTTRTIYNRLEALADDGAIETKKVGARGRVWWRTSGRSRDDGLLERVLDTSPIAILAVDRDCVVSTANDRARELLELADDDVGRRTLSQLDCDLYREDGTPVDDRSNPVSRAFETGESTHAAEYRLETSDGRERWVVVDTAPVTDRNGTVRGAVVALEESTENRERERALTEEQAITRTIFDAAPDTLYSFDEDGRSLRWNDRLREATGYTDEEIAEMEATEFVPEADRGWIEEVIENIAEVGVTRVESALLTKDGERIPYEFSGGPVTDPDGDPIGTISVGRDISERKARERDLQRAQTAVEMSGDVIYALDENGRFTMVNETHLEFSGYDREDLIGEHVSEFMDPADVETGSEVIREILRDDGRERGQFVFEIEQPDGTVRAYENNVAVLTDDGEFRGSVGVVRDITDRRNHERELERQRDELARLNRVNGVIRSIDREIVEAETRPEIEQSVCEEIAASAPYQSAAIGEMTPSHGGFSLRAFAGDHCERFEEVFDAAEPDLVDHGIGPEAARTGEVQAVQDPGEIESEYWRDVAREMGVRSYAIVPIVYGDVLYGLLGVYAHSTGAFDAEERAILGELGETIGHAINAIERKEALMSERVQELEFREHGALSELFAATFGGDGKITVDRTLVLDDGSALQYYTVRGADPERVHAVTEQSEQLRRIRTLSEDGDIARFELLVEGPTLASLFATYGGQVSRMTHRDGEARILGEFPYSADVRQITEAVQSKFPEMTFTARTVRENRPQTAADLGEAVTDRLTQRQRTAIEAAHAAGYFEWPRDSTADDLASGMDIAPPTFHKHLRAAERKLVNAVFEEEAN